MAAFALGHAAGDEVGGAQGFRQCAVERQPPDQVGGFVQRDAGTLHIHALHRFHRPQLFDERPFAPATRHFVQQRGADGGQVRRAARHDQHGDLERAVQGVHVHHVESGEGDALQQDGLHVGAEARMPHQVDQHARGVGAVAAHLAAQHAFQAHAGEHRADDHDVAAMCALERRIVKTNDMGVAFDHVAFTEARLKNPPELLTRHGCAGSIAKII